VIHAVADVIIAQQCFQGVGVREKKKLAEKAVADGVSTQSGALEHLGLRIRQVSNWECLRSKEANYVDHR
jgi:hypothetical protein